jgi:predicted lipoprotein with Yx(FWY)xxD motif
MRKPLVILPAVLAAGAVAVAGCGSTQEVSASTSAAASSTRAVVSTTHGALGTYLVDGRGRTLYLFRKDTGRRSRCSGACAQFWPPLIAHGKPVAKGRAKASLLSTSRRANGSRQVVYNGHPLYRYAPDTKPGQTGGQGVNGFGARWYVVSPSGRAIRASAAATPAPAATSTPMPYTY